MSKLSAHEIFGFMSPTLAREIVEYAHTQDKPLYRTVLMAVAEARKVRPVFLERKPRPEQHQTILDMLTRPRLETVAVNLLQQWLLKGQTAMLTEFLDALGIKHENGAVDELPPAIEADRLKPAVENLLSKYPHEKVAVYLRAFNDLNQARWPALEAMLDQDERLQLKG